MKKITVLIFVFNLLILGIYARKDSSTDQLPFFQYDLVLYYASAPFYHEIPAEINFSILVGNLGTMPVESYSIKLWNISGEQLASETYGAIFPGQQNAINLIYYANSPFYSQVYLTVEFANDQDLTNNSSNLISLMVDDGYQAGARIGFDWEPTQDFPINFYYKNSLAEMIYYADEIDCGGNLTGIHFYYNFNEIPTFSEVNIWYGETELETLEGGFVPSDNLMLGYNGPLEFTIEEDICDLYINFEAPYYYNCENLIILVERCLDEEYYSLGNIFYYSTDNEHDYRTIYKFADSVDLDPTNPPEEFTTTANFSNIAIDFNLFGCGAISGLVTCGGQALVDATVKVIDTNLESITNSEGGFNFAFAPSEQDIIIEASKTGYGTTSIQTTIPESGASIEVTIDIPEIPGVDLFLDILDEENQPIDNATVELCNNDNGVFYMGQSAASGEATISGILAGNYNLTISKEGYITYHNEDIELIDDVNFEICLLMNETDIVEDQNVLANKLIAIYPNPFNPSGAGRSPTTNIRFSVKKDNSKVQIKIYNIKGELVKTICDQKIDSGKHNLNWNGDNQKNFKVSSDLYFCNLSIEKSNFIEKIILLK